MRGRAETARMLFKLAGQDFEDFQFPFSDWPLYKKCEYQISNLSCYEQS